MIDQYEVDDQESDLINMLEILFQNYVELFSATYLNWLWRVCQGIRKAY